MIALATAVLTLATTLTAHAATAQEISGRVTNDAGPSPVTPGSGTGIGVLSGQQLYVNLIDSNGRMVANAPVAANGTYSITGVTVGGNFTLAITTVDEAALGNVPGSPPSITANVPPDWHFTGEGTTWSDGDANGTYALAFDPSAGFDTANFGVALVDTDGDGIPDATDPDWNGNGIADSQESCFNTYFDPAGTTASTPANEPAVGQTANGVSWGQPVLQRTNIMHSGFAPLANDNSVHLERISVGPTSVSDLVAGPGVTLTHEPGPAAHAIDGVDQTSLQAAIAAGDYVTYTMQTDGDFARAHIDWVGLLNRFFSPYAPTSKGDITYQVSSNGGSSWTDLATFRIDPTDPNGPFPAGRRSTRVQPYALAHNTLYTFRYVVYNSSSSGYFELDDPYVAFDGCGYNLSGKVVVETAATLPNANVDGDALNTNGGDPAIWANLIGPDGDVLRSVQVDPDTGTFVFNDINANTDYSVVLSPEALTVGSTAPSSATMPAGWKNVAEDCCDNAGNDGTGDGLVDSPSTNDDISNVNFSIVQTVSLSGNVFNDTDGATEVNGTPISSPGGTQLYAVLVDAAGNVAATVPVASDGTYSFADLTAYSRYTVILDTVNQPAGQTATAPVKPANWANTGESCCNTAGTDGTVDSRLTVQLGSTDSTNNDFGLQQTVSVSGTVFHDADGMTDSKVDGTGISSQGSAPVWVSLVDSTGDVVAVTQPASDGTYTFPGVAAGTYSVRVTTTQPIVGAAAVDPTTATGWLPTGQDCCDNTGSDGTNDNIVTSIVVTTTDVNQVNFGLQQPPTAADVAETLRLNPGGSTQVPAPELTIADPEDGTPTTVVIETLPNPTTQGVLYYDGTPVTAGQRIDNFDPTKLTVDPVNGAVVVEFDYSTIDSAGATSNTATATMPFTVASISLVKSVAWIDDINNNTFTDEGDIAHYRFVVTNTGPTTLIGVTVSDAKLGVSNAACTPILLPGASATCSATATYTITAADVTSEFIENTATTSGTPGVADGSGPLVDPSTGAPFPPVTDTSDAGTDPDGATVTNPGSTETPNPGEVNPNDPDDPGDDPTTVTVDQISRVQLVKSVSSVEDLDENGTDAGDLVHYAFTVTNTGNVTITNLVVTDPKLTVTGGPIASLTRGASDSTTFTGTYTLTEADVAAGAVENSAKVEGTGSKGQKIEDVSDSGTNPDGSEVTDPSGTETPNPLGEFPNDEEDSTEDPTTVTVARRPAILIVKSVDRVEDLDGNGTDAGDVIHYTFDVTNTGNVTLRDVMVTDPTATVKGGPVASLAPSATDSTTFTATYVITDADVAAGMAENVATATGTDPKGTKVTSKSDTGTTPEGSKVPNPTGTETPTPGSKNPNDRKNPGDDPTIVLIAKRPELTVHKSIVATSADTITYQIDAKNTGNIVLTNVTISDAKLGIVDRFCATQLAVGQSCSITVPYTLVQADRDAGRVVNTAIGTGIDPDGKPVTDDSDTGTDIDGKPIDDPDGEDTDGDGDPSDDPTVIELPSNPSLAIDKTAVSSSFTAAGESVEFKIVVTNDGDVTVKDVKVVDSLATSLECPAGNPIASLAPGKSVECKATLITTAKDVSAGKAVNHAEATGTFNETVVTETDSSAVAIDKPSGPLALTGAAIASLLVLTAVLMGLGGVLTFAGRRRRRAR